MNKKMNFDIYFLKILTNNFIIIKDNILSLILLDDIANDFLSILYWI